MKLHFFIPDLTVGGAERVFATLLGLWDRSLDDVTLVVLRREGPYFAGLPKDLNVVSLDAPRLITALPRLWKLWKQTRPDAVLVTQAHANGLLGWLSVMLPKTRFVGRETSLPSRARVQKNIPAWEEAVYRGGYQRLSAVICPSRVVAEELSRDYGLPMRRLPVVPNPVDTVQLETSAKEPITGSLSEFVEAPGSFLVVAAGRLEPVKGFDLLLETAALLPERFRFVIFGEGNERRALEEKVRGLGLETRVLMPGFESNPHRVTARASAFVLSSRYEGFPNAVLEALALGTPVAAFRAPGGAAEILDDGTTGYSAEPENPASLAHALIRVSEQHWPRDPLIARVRERYDGPSVTARYRQVLHEVINA